MRFVGTRRGDRDASRRLPDVRRSRPVRSENSPSNDRGAGCISHRAREPGEGDSPGSLGADDARRNAGNAGAPELDSRRTALNISSRQIRNDCATTRDAAWIVARVEFDNRALMFGGIVPGKIWRQFPNEKFLKDIAGCGRARVY